MNSLLILRARFALPFLTIVVVLVVAAAHVHFVEGVRGSDQFWYLADTETLANNLPPVTNTVFPGEVLRAGNADADTYFAHNGPLLHINALVAKMTGAFHAWKYTNLIFFLLAALFTGLALTILTSRVWGYAGAIVYLVTPVNVWLAVNFLQETFFGFLSAVIFYVCVSDDETWPRIILLLSALMLGTLSHPLYLIVGVFYGLYGLIIRRAWAVPLLAIAVVIAASVLKGVWFPTSFPAGIKDLVASSVPGVTNSIWQLSDKIPDITFKFLLGKFVSALQIQFSLSLNSILYLVTNVGLFALLALFFNRNRRDWAFLYFSAVFMLSYGGMIVLMQNQMRYQLLISSVSIICTLLWLSTWSRLKVQVFVLLAVVTIYCTIDIQMLRRTQVESRMGSQGLVEFETGLGFIEPDSRVALLGDTLGGWLSVISALRPIQAMPVFRSVLDDESFKRVMEIYRADYIFTKEGFVLENMPEAVHILTLENSYLFNVEVYRLDGNM